MLIYVKPPYVNLFTADGQELASAHYKEIGKTRHYTCAVCGWKSGIWPHILTTEMTARMSPSSRYKWIFCIYFIDRAPDPNVEGTFPMINQ